MSRRERERERPAQTNSGSVVGSGSGSAAPPRILSRNADGFFDYSNGANTAGSRERTSVSSDSSPYPQQQPVSPAPSASLSRSGTARVSTTERQKLERDANGFFVSTAPSSSVGSSRGTGDRERERERERGTDRERDREPDRERDRDRAGDRDRRDRDRSSSRRGDGQSSSAPRSERPRGDRTSSNNNPSNGAATPDLDSMDRPSRASRERDPSEKRRPERDRDRDRDRERPSRNTPTDEPNRNSAGSRATPSPAPLDNPPRGTSRRRAPSSLTPNPDEEFEVPLPTRSKSTRRPGPSSQPSENDGGDRDALPRRKPSIAGSDTSLNQPRSRGGTNELGERPRRPEESSSANRLKSNPTTRGPPSASAEDPNVSDSLPRRGSDSRNGRRPPRPDDDRKKQNESMTSPGPVGEDDEKAAIRKAANDRKRKSQFIREKKKKDAETLAREKEEAEEREMRRKERERKELERRDAERRIAEVERFRSEGGYVDVDESIIVPDYVEGIIRTLLADPTVTPNPDDFVSIDGFDSYQRRIQAPLQQVISDFLSERYIDGPLRRAAAMRDREQGPAVVVFLKVMEANDIYVKGNGKPRECYCRIEFGEQPDDGQCGSKNTETFVTETVSSMQNPFLWNQHLNLEAKSLNDRIIVSVWDQRKDEFLGQVKLNVQDIVQRNEVDGYVSKWYTLQPREKGKKDKYVGGGILLEFNIDRSKTDAAMREGDRDAYLESELIAAKINFVCLYKLLLKSCLALDMLIIDINESTIDMLSNESKTLLRVFGRKWAIGEAVQFISYVELLFNKYKSYEIPVNALFVAYESIYNRIKSNSNWLTKYDKPSLSDLSDQMHDYYRTQVIKYKEFFPKNRPNGALESTILMWRMVFKSAIYREAHPNAPASFKDQIKDIIKASCKNRYEKLYELTSAIDENDLESVIDGLVKLTQMLTDEIEMDAKYYQNAFRKDVDIVKISVEIYSASFLGTIDEMKEFFVSAEGVAVASKGIFELLKQVRRMDAKLNKIVPGKSNINAEKLFQPFMLKWLDYISTKTMEWVANAVTADNFEPINDFDRDGPPHSSSVMDVFTAVNHELNFIIDLKWSNQIQAAGFYQKFAKTIYTAIEQYCDVIGTGELKPVAFAGRQWSDLLQMRSEKKGPTDIASESCVKLCNIEFALSKLEDLNKIMDVAALQRTVKDYRATIAPALKQKALDSKAGKADDDEPVKGAFSIAVMYAENIKPVTNAGLANAYVTIRVPEGTIVPIPDSRDVTEIDAGSPAVGSAPTSPPPVSANSVSATPQSVTPQMPEVLTGSKCEMARTRVISDSINPIWDEVFTLLLPPITKLDVMVYSKNLITNDPLSGQASLDLSAQSRLKRKLADHHTHDLFLELEPQGRLLLRLTLEGEEEDVEFWFRRAREKLGRTRNDFVRSLCVRISPYVREVLVKALKEQEAAPIKKEGFFSALQKTQYSNLTAGGAEISKAVSSREADDILAPLTDYLNKNLGTLFSGLSARMATEVIKKIWEDSLLVIETALIPQLYGQIERDRRVLNVRQVSVLNLTLDILKQFFHADGADLGLPIKSLETKKYIHDTKLIDVYERELRKLKQDYEKSLQDGREKEYILRLIRLRVEKQEELSSTERDDGRKWIEVQLVNRKERKT
ncbi:hypothetical protein HDU81_011018 [Chytriomyces hyalinus]|nr:hypothetical protein HDU81_011018 [Chytriomyces hyalinus]